MKQRPRRVEREIAKRITLVSEIVGADAVLRIPANGRTGPDIEINQLGLVMDVKSRESISKKMMVTKPTIFNQDFFDQVLNLFNRRRFALGGVSLKQSHHLGCQFLRGFSVAPANGDSRAVDGIGDAFRREGDERPIAFDDVFDFSHALPPMKLILAVIIRCNNCAAKALSRINRSL